ncbi:hypothetical protein BKA70DRAFT_1217481 [Coprinopsis sp. MPI-PUGE-AT-0042]|nr:hypothetical protein BKA70DRAFT_1217481 [Coprinopsis sp. MPI-PUGE-AT-0042]
MIKYPKTVQTIRKRSVPVKPSSLTLKVKRRAVTARGVEWSSQPIKSRRLVNGEVLVLKKPGEGGDSEDGERNGKTKRGQGRNLLHSEGAGSCEDYGHAEDNCHQG